MAKGDRQGPPPPRPHRGGGSSDQDHDLRPGSSTESREYAKLYDAQGEQEYTNMLENPNQLEERIIARDALEDVETSQAALQEALARIQFWPSVGRFIIPKENTFAGHLQLVQNNPNADIHFDPDTYAYFDRIIAEQAHRPEVFDPKNPHYASYQPLRDNLAVLRNDVMGFYMDDGSFDPGDEKYVPCLREIADAIGHGMRKKGSIGQLFSPTLEVELMNIEGEGARHTYQFARSRQVNPGVIGQIISFGRGVIGLPRCNWELPPVEETPFSLQNLSAAPVRDEMCECTPTQLRERGDALAEERLQQSARNTVDVLTNPDKREAVDHGKTILEWFKNLKFENKGVMDAIDTGNPEERADLKSRLSEALAFYHEMMDKMVEVNPNVVNLPSVERAEEQAEVLDHSIKLLAALEKPIGLAQTQQISSDVTQQPERWDELKDHTVDRLMQTLKGGLEDAVGSLQQQEQAEEQQSEEAAEQAIEAAMMAQASSKRRKRKQRSSSLIAKKARKADKDIKADDYALKQGAHAKPAKQVREVEDRTAPVSSVAPKDLEAIKQLGKSLMQSSKTGDELAAAQALLAQNVKTDEQQVSGLDEQATQRVTNQRDRDQNNPKRL